MRKFIIGIVAAAAMLAVPSMASANVAVTDGVGFVGKGDVQTAFTLDNDQAMQDLFKTKSITFGSTMTRTTDNIWHCTGVAETQHSYRVTVMNRPITAIANTNNAGKLTNGWNLTGIGSAPYAVLSDTGSNPVGTLSCPAGSSLDFTRPFALNQIGVAKYTTYSYGGLTVTSTLGTRDLPNTPVEVAPVA